MLEKLLAFLLHAKAGAISGVLLLGATGALVTVSASNGTTTITITQASASPTITVPPTSTPTATGGVSHTPSPSASPRPSSSLSSPSASACADEAKAIALQVQRVDSAFAGFHTELMHLRRERDLSTLKKADHLLREIRTAAVKAIHRTRTCGEDRHEDNDNDEDDESTVAPATQPAASSASVVESESGTSEDHDRSNGITFSGSDPQAIADQAVAAMQAAFDSAKDSPARTRRPESSRKPESARSRKPTHTPDGDHDGE